MAAVAARAAQGRRDPDRGALAREAEDGRIENTYRLQVMNTAERAVVCGQRERHAGLELRPSRRSTCRASTRSVPVRLRARADDVPPGSSKVVIAVKSLDDPGVAVEEKTVFLGLPR